jgi:hypothetical protein
MHDARPRRGHDRTPGGTEGPPPGYPTEQEDPADSPSPEPVPGDEWVGWRVTDELGQSVGRVEGTDGKRWLVVDQGPERRVLVPTAEAIACGDTVFLPYPHELIDSAPQPHAAAPIRGRRLASARRHYGLD